jgi:hypothetical protein
VPVGSRTKVRSLSRSQGVKWLDGASLVSVYSGLVRAIQSLYTALHRLGVRRPDWSKNDMEEGKAIMDYDM